MVSLGSDFFFQGWEFSSHLSSVFQKGTGFEVDFYLEGITSGECFVKCLVSWDI